MPRRYSFTVSSVVPAPPAAVWARVASFQGVDDELMPIVRMTSPAGIRQIDPATVPLGRPWFRSWLLLFGLEFEPRVPGVGCVLRGVFAAVFRHRHRRLARHFRQGRDVR